MTSDSPSLPWLEQVKQFRCLDCGSEIGFRSRRRSFSERFILPVFLLQPVRCGECFRRDYRLVFTQVKDRLSEVSGMIPPSRQAVAPKRNVA